MKKYGLYVLVGVTCLITILSLVVFIAERQRDKEDDIRQKAEIAIAQTVESCINKNESRNSILVYESYYLYLVTLSNPTTAEDPRLQELRNYLSTAFDPVSCDPNDPNFGKDLTPPPELPQEALPSLPVSPIVPPLTVGPNGLPIQGY